MLRRPFYKQYRLSQGFGENPDVYSKFGIKGHNGLDYATPKGTILVSPIDGKITEVGLDANGYGAYVKIENDSEGHLLAHMSRIDVTVNQEVYEGQVLGLSGGQKGDWGAGNTTGAHLHWGRFPKPRNRDNGYSGYEDQADLLISWDEQLKLPEGRTYVNKAQGTGAGATIPVDAKEFPKLVNKATKWDATVRDVLNTSRPSEEVPAQEVKDLQQKLTTERDDAVRRLSNIKAEVVDGQTVGYYITELDNREQQVARLKVEHHDLQTTYDRFKVEVAKGNDVAEAQRKADTLLIYQLQGQVEEQGKALGDLTHEKAEAVTAKETAENRVKELEIALEQAKSNGSSSLTIYDALELVIIKVVQALKGIKLK